MDENLYDAIDDYTAAARAEIVARLWDEGNDAGRGYAPTADADCGEYLFSVEPGTDREIRVYRDRDRLVAVADGHGDWCVDIAPRRGGEPAGTGDYEEAR